MNSAELEANADKQAFPWQCIMCRKTYHYVTGRVKLSWGDLCIDCFPSEAEA